MEDFVLYLLGAQVKMDKETAKECLEIEKACLAETEAQLDKFDSGVWTLDGPKGDKEALVAALRHGAARGKEAIEKLNKVING